MKPPIIPSGFSFFAVDQLVNFMSNAYQGLLQVFRDLTVQELMAAAGVCRLWRDLVSSPFTRKSRRITVC